MKVLLCFLAVVAVVYSGVIPSGDVGSISLKGLDQTAYSLNGLSTGGYVLSDGKENLVQNVDYQNQGAVIGSFGDSQALARALQILCPDQVQPANNVQLVEQSPELRTVQYVQPAIQSTAELNNNFQVISQGPQQTPELGSFQIVQQEPASEPEVRYVQLVSQQQPVPAPELNYLQLVKQVSAPALEGNYLQIVKQAPVLAPEVRTVQLISGQPTSHLKTLQLISQGGEISAPLESNTQIHAGASGAQIFRILQQGDVGSEQKFFKIIRS